MKKSKQVVEKGSAVARVLNGGDRMRFEQPGGDTRMEKKTECALKQGCPGEEEVTSG